MRYFIFERMGVIDVSNLIEAGVTDLTKYNLWFRMVVPELGKVMDTTWKFDKREDRDRAYDQLVEFLKRGDEVS